MAIGAGLHAGCVVALGDDVGHAFVRLRKPVGEAVHAIAADLSLREADVTAGDMLEAAVVWGAAGASACCATGSTARTYAGTTCARHASTRSTRCSTRSAAGSASVRAAAKISASTTAATALAYWICPERKVRKSGRLRTTSIGRTRLSGRLIGSGGLILCGE